VLDYIVTCNHVHLLVKDTGSNIIADSMQLIAGHTAQEYNQRKNRQGAFWEDRYHATAIEGNEHLHRQPVAVIADHSRARYASCARPLPFFAAAEPHSDLPFCSHKP
jgi:putative transposase